MNNQDLLRRFRSRLFLKTFLIIFASAAGLFLVLFLVDGIFNDSVAEFLSFFNRDFYVFLRSHKIETFLCLFALVVLIAFCITLGRSVRYIRILVDSIDKVFQKDEAFISLPADFKDIENKLNTIKYDSLKSEQIAKEAEQRKNDLVVYLAHDLKTPLTSVIGYLSLLSEEQDISPELRQKYLNISLDKAQRLEALINEFFEITRYNLQNIVLEVGRVNLSFLLCQLVDEFYPLFMQKDLDCRTSIAPDLVLQGDSDRLARVFDNILRNAINYSDEGTEITVFASESGGKITVAIRNHGDQIPAHRLESIFEKFYRLDSTRSSRRGGSGLGLAIAKEIVELHQGTVTATSTPEYTEFIIVLPIL